MWPITGITVRDSDFRFRGKTGHPFRLAERLLLLHDPDAIPLVGRRIRLIIAATVEKNLRGSILWSQFKRIGKVCDSALPVPSSVAIETSLILIDDLRELREGLGRMMAEGLIDPARPR